MDVLRSLSRRAPRALACLLAGSLVACAPRPRAALWTVAPTAPRWPAAPDTARLAWVGQLASADDVGARRSVFRRVADLFTGRRAPRVTQPYGVAIDGRDRILVADQGARGIHRFSPATREYEFIADVGRTRFEAPVGVAADSLGRFWVSDARLALVVAFDERGRERCRLATGLVRPAGLAVDAHRDALYIVDTQAHRLVVMDLECRVRASFGRRGEGPGEFNFPTNVSVGDDGAVYVSDSMNFRVQVLGPDGAYRRSFGQNGDRVGDLARPKGIGSDGAGRVYVVEGLFDAVNIFDGEGRHLLTFGSAGHRAGEFWLATGLAIGRGGHVVVADSFNARVQLFQLLAPVP